MPSYSKIIDETGLEMSEDQSSLQILRIEDDGLIKVCKIKIKIKLFTHQLGLSHEDFKDLNFSDEDVEELCYI